MIEKKIIGRKDFASFPELGLEKVAIKIDTGAYTSSIHCHHIEEITIDGERLICFDLFDPDHKNYSNQKFTTSKYKQKVIKSSSGHAEKRFVIKTNILLFGIEYPIELSLSERGTMKYPILIGRKLLKKKFIVDTAKINLSFKHQKNNSFIFPPRNTEKNNT
jgi:hypothetical protein